MSAWLTGIGRGLDLDLEEEPASLQNPEDVESPIATEGRGSFSKSQLAECFHAEQVLLGKVASWKENEYFRAGIIFSMFHQQALQYYSYHRQHC